MPTNKNPDPHREAIWVPAVKRSYPEQENRERMDIKRGEIIQSEKAGYEMDVRGNRTGKRADINLDADPPSVHKTLDVLQKGAAAHNRAAAKEK